MIKPTKLDKMKSKLRRKVEQRNRAKDRADELAAEARNLVWAIFIEEERQLYEKVAALDEIPWRELCWPSESWPAKPDKDPNRHPRMCIVCRSQITGVDGYWRGAFIGRGMSFDDDYMTPNLYSHAHCVPAYEKNLRTLD